MKVGTKVRMTRELKERFINNGSWEHVKEFGSMTGTVIEKRADVACWPEVEVTWGDTGLRYLYLPEDLEVAG